MTHLLSRRALVLLYMSAATLALMLFSTALEYRKRHEPDPLTVTAPNQPDIYYDMRPGDLFTFLRTTCTTKDLIVNVHREFASDNGETLYQLPSVAYGAYAANNCVDVFFTGVVPMEIEPGWYDYRPILIYDVNDVLQIAKAAPVVRVEITK